MQTIATTTTTLTATARFVRAVIVLTIAALALVAIVAPPTASAAPAKPVKPAAITVTSVTATKNDAKLDVYRVTFSNGTTADVMRSLGSTLDGSPAPVVGKVSGFDDTRWYIPLTTTRGGGDVRWSQTIGTGKKARTVPFVGY